MSECPVARPIKSSVYLTAKEKRWVDRTRGNLHSIRVWRHRGTLKMSGLNQDCVAGTCGKRCREEYWMTPKPEAKR